ncbi:MAG: hypothetical protein JWQ03_1762, partial [Variovorax sp.]|nr:hypothetical protein [Variovorax sp.]
MDPVVQGSVELADLAVGGHPQPAAGRIDAQFGRDKDAEIPGLTQATGEGAQAQAQQPPAPGAVGDVGAQHSALQAVALADLKALGLVDVVAHEHQRRAMHESLAFHGQRDIYERASPKRPQHGPGKGRPFAAPQTRLLVLAVADQVDIEADAGVVEEEEAIDLANVD